jgi:hypothetical protein
MAILSEPSKMPLYSADIKISSVTPITIASRVSSVRRLLRSRSRNAIFQS